MTDEKANAPAANFTMCSADIGKVNVVAEAAPTALVENDGMEPVTETRWQNAIYELCKKSVGSENDYLIDGGGCDSGDALDVSLAEIRQAIGFWRDKAEAAPTADGWVSVEERLPKDGENVLCAFLSYDDKFLCAEVAEFDTDSQMWFATNNDYYDKNRVAFWREIPTFPALPSPPAGHRRSH